MSVDTVTKTDALNDTKTARVRHLVPLDKKTGKPEDRALCGFMWDMMNVKPNGTLCKKCYDIAKERGDL